MQYKAVALCRVSSVRQRLEGNSLEAQEKYVYECASYHDAEIIKIWSLNASSKKGKNLARKDLREIYDFCKHIKKVRYFILDEPDRFMRSLDEYYWWKVEFRKIGVYLAYAKMPEITHQDDPLAVMREMMEVFKGEASNHERITKTTDKMKMRVATGYYPFYPHQGYKKTAAADGLHVPDEPRYSLLKTALKAIANYEMTVKEALNWLHANGYTTPKGNRRLALDKFVENILLSPYYAGILQVRDWPVNENGLQKAMITKEEHEIIAAIASGRKVRQKKKFNPDFQLNLARHKPCNHTNAKLTGINHVNGKGWTRKEYVCRICKKRVPQAKVHASLDQTLSCIKLSEETVDEFFKALQAVWHKNETVRQDTVAQLENQRDHLKTRKSELITTLSANPDLANDIKEEIIEVKSQLVSIESKIANSNNIDEELEGFLKFAIEYTEDLRGRWWTLPGESLVECKQLLFKDEIFVDQDSKVYTPKISLIYTLANQKSDPKVAQNGQLVELPSTALGSAGLSWLFVYRYSSFCGLRTRGSKQTNISCQQSQILATNWNEASRASR